MNVLFICDGNAARSQEAEVFYKVFLHGGKAESAGVNAIAGKPIPDVVEQVMREKGLSTEGCHRKKLTEDHMKAADIVVSFVKEESLPLYARAPHVIYWGVPDPRYKDQAFHREVRDDIEARVASLVKAFAK